MSSPSSDGKVFGSFLFKKSRFEISTLVTVKPVEPRIKVEKLLQKLPRENSKSVCDRIPTQSDLEKIESGIKAYLSTEIASLRRDLISKSEHDPLETSPTRTPNVLLSVQQVAEHIQVSVRSVERLVASGKLRVLWIGGTRRVHPKTLEAFIRSCEKSKRHRRSYS